MKKVSTSLALVLIGLMTIGVTNTWAQKKMKKEPVLWAAEDIKWVQLKGAVPGVMSATLWGNQEKSPYGGLIKFPAGFEAPLHYHTSDIKIIVIKGAYIYTPEGGTRKRFGPGSYVSYPGGDRHTTHGAEDSETVFFIEQPGKFDINMIGEGMEKK